MAQWDPKSYLVEAAVRHLRSIDVEASATTKVNYYDSISTHLRNTDVHMNVETEVRSQQSDPSVRVFSGIAMCVPYTVICPQEAVAHIGEDKIESTIAECFAITERIFSPFTPTSELSRVNAAPAGEAIPLSEEMLQVLDVVEMVHHASEGLFDPSWAGAATAWQNALKHNEKTTTLPEHGGWGYNVILHRANGTLVKKFAAIQIDLCALSKGWCVDKIAERLGRSVGTNICVDWGGDAVFCGRHPSMLRPWISPILKPPKLPELFSVWQGDKAASPKDYLHSIENLQDCAVATSGDYAQLQRFGYTHIFHPKRLEPMKVSDKNVSSATVVAKSCMIADALATALLLTGRPSQALEFIIRFKKSHPGILQRYYLYVRNDEMFFHDGDGRGRSDEERLRAIGGVKESMNIALNALLIGDVRSTGARDVMKGTPTLYSVCVIKGSDKASPYHAAILSSVIQCGMSHMTLNVMKESVLFNSIRVVGTIFAVHVLSSKDLSEAVATRDFGGSWLKAAEVIPHALHPSHVLHMKNLAHNVRVCRSTKVTDCGDHIFVICDILAQEWPADASPLLYAHRAFYCQTRDGGIGVLPQNLGNVGVVTAFHRHAGPIGMPVLHIRCCSLSPLMLSFALSTNCVARAVLFEASSKTVQIHTMRSEVDWFGSEEHRKRHSSNPLGYLPFPAFRGIPNVLSAVEATVLTVEPLDPSVDPRDWTDESVPGWAFVLCRVERIVTLPSNVEGECLALCYTFPTKQSVEQCRPVKAPI